MNIEPAALPPGYAVAPAGIARLSGRRAQLEPAALSNGSAPVAGPVELDASRSGSRLRVHSEAFEMTAPVPHLADTGALHPARGGHFAGVHRRAVLPGPRFAIAPVALHTEQSNREHFACLRKSLARMQK
jgi:hypothetical protein